MWRMHWAAAAVAVAAMALAPAARAGCKKDSQCDDNNKCTTDFCFKVDSGICKHVKLPCPSTKCIQGSCKPATGRVAKPKCDDGFACTTDECETSTGACSYGADDSLCDDGIACTLDQCHLAAGCIHGPVDALCDDDIDCTVDACDAALGCAFTPSAGVCDGGIDCTVDACADTSPGVRALCDPLGGCATTPQLLGDITTFGTVDVTDVQCEIVAVLAVQASTPPPGCLEGSPAHVDLDCDGTPTVADTVLAMQQALGMALSPELDADGVGCPDTCP